MYNSFNMFIRRHIIMVFFWPTISEPAKVKIVIIMKQRTINCLMF